ncbi:MAG TPA: rhodanese-like domain-containing protein [Verrucomicrobiae bacterium]|nr:rhodanese-like domain-containing protein [Verrucomicrobiae bacterium]
MKATTSLGTVVPRLSALMVAVVLACAWGTVVSSSGQSDQPEPARTLPSDPWRVNQLMKPEELARTLAEASGEKPLVLYVGYPVLYQGGHIAGSKFIGPASKPEGLQALKQAVQDLPRDKQVVLYCGCCPWKECPNIRPAFRTVQDRGFKNVKVLYLPKNFRRDWIANGFPIQKRDEAK